jgi:hypothetical protein
MNKLKLINRAFICLAVTFFVATGCSKDDPKPDEVEKPFIEWSANEQSQYLIKEFKSRGGDYGLVGVTTYKEDGTVESGYNPEPCERDVIISVPMNIPDQAGVVDKSLVVKQIVPEGACGREYSDIFHTVVNVNFANYKAGISFYTVEKNLPQLDYQALMFFDPTENTDPEYLILNTFRKDDLQRMNNGEPNIVARRYKQYVFQKK